MPDVSGPSLGMGIEHPLMRSVDDNNIRDDTAQSFEIAAEHSCLRGMGCYRQHVGSRDGSPAQFNAVGSGCNGVGPAIKFYNCSHFAFSFRLHITWSAEPGRHLDYGSAEILVRDCVPRPNSQAFHPRPSQSDKNDGNTILLQLASSTGSLMK